MMDELERLQRQLARERELKEFRECRAKLAHLATGIFLYTFIWVGNIQDDTIWAYGIIELIIGCLVIYGVVLAFHAVLVPANDIDLKKPVGLDYVKAIAISFGVALLAASILNR
jgi:hypothetical protein